jgi:VWFA-related protein
MKLRQGRKALIVMADGYHIGNHGGMAIMVTQEADTLIYTIRIADPQYGNMWRENLQTISQVTGGSYFELSRKKGLEQIYADIEEELRSRYILSYTPETDVREGYRRIKVKVNRKGLVANGRDGYYPKNPAK